MSQHTPGPWNVHLDGPFVLGGDCIPVEAMTADGMVSREVCTLMMDTDDFPDGKEWKEDAANARLIAASPDLLEACKAVLLALSYGKASPDPSHQNYVNPLEVAANCALAEKKVKAAIAKATGEPR